jgi:hypothetical protein
MMQGIAEERITVVRRRLSRILQDAALCVTKAPRTLVVIVLDGFAGWAAPPTPAVRTVGNSGVPVVRVIERTYSERCDTLTWTTRARAGA